MIRHPVKEVSIKDLVDRVGIPVEKQYGALLCTSSRACL